MVFAVVAEDLDVSPFGAGFRYVSRSTLAAGAVGACKTRSFPRVGATEMSALPLATLVAALC